MASNKASRGSLEIGLDRRSVRSACSYTSSYLKETSINTIHGPIKGIPILSSDIPNCQRAILDIIIGHASAKTPMNEYSTLYLRLLNHRVNRFSNSELARAVLVSNSPGNRLSRDGPLEIPITLSLFRALVIIARTLDTGTATINEIAKQLLGLINSETITHELYQFVFRGISLISLLFDAEESISSSPAKFRMVLQQNSGPFPSTSRHQQSSVWRRLSCDITDGSGGNVHIDLDQLLSHFGSCVPAPCLRPFDPRRDFYADILVASNLSYYMISRIGKLRVEWVESLSLHLDLHERSSKLRLFAFPSFCALLCQQFEKQDTFLSKIVCASEDIETPSTSINHSVQYAYSYDFLIEVLCSYILIFGQDQKSYTRLSSIPSLEVVDPLLESLCGRSCKKQEFYSNFKLGEAKAQYTASADFPLLGQRLLNLQNYMNERNPSDLRTLWYDRRDILRFYTFWAVFLVGGISISISALSLGLTAVQVREVYNK